MQGAPAWFLYRERLYRWAVWPRQKLGHRLYYGLMGTVGLSSILFIGHQLCDSLDRSSSIARQTLLNVRADQGCQRALGTGPLQIEGGLKGDLNQIGGHANVRFTVVNPSTGLRGEVHVQAKRHYLNWQTQSLEVKAGDEIIVIR